MTLPRFGEHAFAGTDSSIARDAFDLVTGEALQNDRGRLSDRSFLVDENVQAVVARIHGTEATSSAKDALIAPYVGKWIIVEFGLADLVSRFGMEIVSAEPPSKADPKVPLRYGLTCIFDSEPWGEKLAGLPVGTRMTVLGQIELLGPYAIRLRNCELA